MNRLLIFVVALTAAQFAFTWVLTHFALAILGAGGWWMWSLWQGRNDA